jgi:hypothetical protein
MVLLKYNTNIKINVNTGLEEFAKINTTLKELTNEIPEVPKLLRKIHPKIEISHREIVASQCEIGWIYEVSYNYMEEGKKLPSSFTKYLQRYEKSELSKIPLRF